MIRNLRLAAFATAALPAAALAGGYTPPVVQAPIVIAPSEQVAAPLWAGAYVGGALGYAFNGDDRVGMENVTGGVAAGSVTPSGHSLDVKGPAASLALGYRWQRNNWVYGPELSVDFGKVEDDYEAVAGGSTFTDGGKSEVNHIISLKFKGGSLVNEQTLVYGLAGIAYGDFTYTQGTGEGALSVDYDATRYVIGAGVERKINDRLSLFGEWNYYNFGKTDVFFPASEGSDSGVQTVATPEHHLIKIGLNYQF
ncbi:MAG: outer membrane beta-barrel protein [Paracoccus sp. (in: a-proteobacteria)]|uniref:outer membrane protein n=1 Tax=Paracoccus sp. TaxID=267 RepID=UPI0026DFFD06|nr:outer membrane beta-barrel protein [Paracoccus sp. (in: a-proteobacteria)]MDO5631679.1 outer membrane beta-barrel protein [Paracoccus sp. (in: a-proteobacteria)]